MIPSSPSTSAHSALPTDCEESIRHLPAEARAAFERFQSERDPMDLNPVIFAILEDYVPRSPVVPLAELPGTTRLIEDLGFDSLAITEVVFFTEDLFGIKISNEEMIQVRTLDGLGNFIQDKAAARAAR